MRPLTITPRDRHEAEASYPDWDTAMRAQPTIRLSDENDPFGRMRQPDPTPDYVKGTGPFHGADCWCGCND